MLITVQVFMEGIMVVSIIMDFTEEIMLLLTEEEELITIPMQVDLVILIEGLPLEEFQT